MPRVMVETESLNIQVCGNNKNSRVATVHLRVSEVGTGAISELLLMGTGNPAVESALCHTLGLI